MLYVFNWNVKNNKLKDKNTVFEYYISIGDQKPLSKRGVAEKPEE